MGDLKIKICPYLKGLFELRDKLSTGINAIEQCHDIEHDNYPSCIDDDKYLEACEKLTEFQKYLIISSIPYLIR